MYLQFLYIDLYFYTLISVLLVLVIFFFCYHFSITVIYLEVKIYFFKNISILIL